MVIEKILRLCVLAGLLAFQGASHAAVMAMLLDVRGPASVHASGRTSAAQIAVSLQEDANVEVGAGGVVVLVHYATREQTTVSGPARVKITPTGIESLAGTPGKSRKLGDGEARVAADYRGRVVPGALAMRGPGNPVAIVYPANGETILDPARPFSWESGDDKNAVQVRLFGEGKLLGERTLVGNRIAAPQLADRLQADTSYRLEVTVEGNKPANATFKVAADDQRRAAGSMKPSDKADVVAWVMYAMSLEAGGYVTDAKEAWRAVAELRPSAGEVAQRMGR